MYLEQFTCLEDVIKAYNIEEKDLNGMQIICAIYACGHYDGRSLVLLKKEDNFFIVDASHCSYYGLEDQWSPVKTNEILLRKEIEAKSSYAYDDFASFIEFCNQYFKWA